MTRNLFLHIGRLLILLQFTDSWSRSAFTCKDQAPWKVDNQNNADAFLVFQSWLTHWQSNCSKGNSPGIGIGGGLGSTFQGTARWLITAIEMGYVYRPEHTWKWADNEHEHCTFAKPYFDCYFEPFSSCFVNQSSIKNDSRTPIPLLPESFPQTNLILFQKLQGDSCNMAAKMNKSLQWIHGNFLHYLTRPNQKVAAFIELRKKYITDVRNLTSQQLSVDNSSSSNNIGKTISSSIIGVHVRGGKPDNKRKAANISHYLNAIDIVANQLAALGRPVDSVFLCSDLPEETFISTAHMQKQYPRPWKYIEVPHISLGGGEAELNLGRRQNPEAGLQPNKRDLAMEYLADIEILAGCDAFIGSHSNIYPVVTALKIGRGLDTSKFANHSCIIDIQHDPPEFFCEGSTEIVHIWQQLSQGGYDGGAMF